MNKNLPECSQMLNERAAATCLNQFVTRAKAEFLCVLCGEFFFALFCCFCFFFFLNMDHPGILWVSPSLDFGDVADFSEASYTFHTRGES